VKWEEVERCLKGGDPELLIFDSDDVLSRSQQVGDLFAPVLKLRQKLPAVEELRKLPADSATVSSGPALRAASKRGAAAGKRRSAVSEQLTQAGRAAPLARNLRSTSKGRKNAKPQAGATASKRRPA
jgi:hypothetical protein